MQLKIKGKVLYTYSGKRFLYMLCFFAFCVLDQRCKTDNGRYLYRDLTGVVMAVVTMSHYRLRDFRKWKIPYLIWTILYFIALPIAYTHKSILILLEDWIVIAAGVFLYGFILIHTFISVVIEKEYPKLNLKFGALWLAMMLWMILARTYVWPFCYLVMFGCFYLTNYSQEEQNDLFQGMLDGIILGFFIIQGLCFVFRPYDEVRYSGLFINPNNNSLFYLEVLAAVFAKLLYVTRTHASKWVKVYYWVGAGTVLAFELLTIGRTGWLTAIFLIIGFLFFIGKYQGLKRWWKNLLVLSVCVCLTFPLCFSAVRYLPPLFHHPVWFAGEWHSERVYSWDPWNSEKYIDIDEYLGAALGRVLDSFGNLLEHSPFLMRADAAQESPENKIPVLSSSEDSDGYLVRSTIYRYYFQHLRLWGQPYSEQGFQLSEHFWVWHAHNIYLQYGTDFGAPAMIMFAALLLWGAVSLGKRFARHGAEADAVCWMFLVIPMIFGIFEYCWGSGSLSILLLFVAWRKVICSGE